MWYGLRARHRQDACATSKTSEMETLYIGLFGGNHGGQPRGDWRAKHLGGKSTVLGDKLSPKCFAPTVDVINNPICHFSALGHYF